MLLFSKKKKGCRVRVESYCQTYPTIKEGQYKQIFFIKIGKRKLKVMGDNMLLPIGKCPQPSLVCAKRALHLGGNVCIAQVAQASNFNKKVQKI